MEIIHTAAISNVNECENNPGGIYNFGSETTKSMYEITRDFIEALGLDIELTEAPPAWNLWMDCSKAKKYGVVFSDVSEALIRCAEDNGMLI